MKRHLLFAALCATLATTSAFARDSVAAYPVDAALISEPGKVGSDIALYFAGQPHAAVVKSLGVFLSAVIELQERARKEGGNAVINIKSNYKDQLTESATTFQCGAGAVIAGVALTGDVVTLKK